MKQFCFLAAAALILVACEMDPSEEPFKGTYTVSGTVEKGPFVQGSTINMQTMDGKLHTTGQTFIETIKDDAGTFDFGSQEFDTQYAKITATGYFFNEVTGGLSQGMINLNALVDLSDKSSVNVNLLTHLKSQRIQKLIEDGNTFKAASSQAQTELMGAFGLQKYAGKDVSQFSITTGTDEAAALIAVSSIIQVGRSEAGMTEFISKLTNDFAASGSFSDNTKETITESIENLQDKLDNIADNIVDRYEKLGKTVSVKPLKYYFDWDGNGVVGDEILPEGASVSLDQTVINVPAEGGTYTVKVTSPISVYLNENAVGDITPIDAISEETIDLYDIDNQNEMSLTTSIDDNIITIVVNPSTMRVEGSKEIFIYDRLGAKLATITVNQAANSDSSLPGLSNNGEQIIAGMAIRIGDALSVIDQLERMYVQSSSFGSIQAPMNASDYRIDQTWTKLYVAISSINTVREIDAAQLNVYGPFLDFYAALCYRWMTHIWGGVVYHTQNPSMDNPHIPRTEVAQIQQDLVKRLEETLKNTEDKTYYGCSLAIRDLFFMPSNFVKIILGELFLDMGLYEEANAYLQEVYASGYYSLDENPSDAIYLEGSSNPYLFGMSKNIPTKSVPDDGAYVIIFSYGEVLLSLAECRYKIGDDAGALYFVNMVGTAKGWDAQRTDKTKILEYILELRKQEKYPYHFAFLKRNNLAQSELGITDSNYLLLPIPQSEVDYNWNMTQNPGY